MSRRSAPTIEFDALAIEGGLLPPEWLSRVAALEAGAQAPADYDIKKGLQLRDEITRYWRIAEALWAELDSARAQRGHDESAVTHAFVRQLLIDVFGFDDLAAAGEREVEGRRFPIDFEARDGRVPVVVGRPGEGLDQSVARHGDGMRRRSAWGALQEYLNAEDGVLWGIVCNGPRLRLGRDNASLTRPAWLEMDLERIFAEERFADFSVLWLTLHASRFGRPDQPPEDAPLEVWRTEARERGSRARTELRTGVEAALLELGQGFLTHRDNVALREQLASGALTPQEYFNELLRFVYRVIFLLTVEEREILHPQDATEEARTLYADGYGLRRLRERAVRCAGYDRHTDLWASLRPVFSALGRPGGEPALGLRGLGGLFAPEQCPHLDTATLENRSLLTALFRLAWIREGDALARVNWRDMGPEELGSVYESLLELVPLVSDHGRRFTFAGADESAGNARKLTGSYYTPDELVQELLDSALEPVVAERLAAQPQDQERALLSITVIDPACGSGHFLLAAARRLATHLARVRSGGTPGAEEYRHALRDVVTHCIHGVDRNPMALELARMALWLEAYTPDRALGFLDHHLVCGDALVGLLDLGVLRDGIPDDAYTALTGDDKDVVKTLRKLNRDGRRALEKRKTRGEFSLQLGTHTLAEAFAQLDQLGDEGIESVEAKRAHYAALRAQAEERPVALAADLFLAAFLMPKALAQGERELTEAAAAARFPATATLGMALEGTLGTGHSLVQAARRTCRDARVLHWPLAFPQVFEHGGFDVVLGNPPWEMLQTDAQEFFAARDPEIAQAPTHAARQAMIEGRLRQENRSLYDAFRAEEARVHRMQAFVHGGGRYPLSAVGRINLAPLFAETGDQLRGDSGRMGFVLPSGIATDSFTQQLFRHFADGRIVSLYDFENRSRIFPAVDSRVKFCLLTVGRAEAAEFAFFTTHVSQLADARRRFRLTSDDFALINPNTRTCPVFRSEADADLSKKIYQRAPVLVDESRPAEEGNPWRLSFMLMFMMNTDSRLFLDARAPGALPLYEGKMIHQFDHRWATYEPTSNGRGAPSSRDVTNAEKADADFAMRPRYWVPAADVHAKLGNAEWTRSWLVGWRDICRGTDERTTICSVVPIAGVGNNLPLMLPAAEIGASACAALIANLNSLVLDFSARFKVGGTHLNFFIYKQLPVLPPSRYTNADLDFVIPRVIELTYTARDLTPWARDLGYDGEPFAWDPAQRAVLRAELDAYYARLYGLTRDELRYVLDPADVLGPDYPSETFRVLKNNEEREFGEYRTQRLVLEAWDALAAGRLLASRLGSILKALQAPPPIKPSLDSASEAALSVIALVRAAGGSLSLSALVRSYGLRNHPGYVVQNAPARLRPAAQAWAERRGSNPGPSLVPVLQRLVDGGALAWQTDGDLERISTTPSTPEEGRLSAWSQYEAGLLLAVADGLQESKVATVDAELPAEDRTLLRAIQA